MSWFPLSIGHEPQSWQGPLQAYLDWLASHHYSERTCHNRQKEIRRFIDWAEARGLGRPQEVTVPVVERYQRHLYLYRKADGAPLSVSSQREQLIGLKQWFRWLVRQRRLLYNPAAELTLPRADRRLPKHILSVSEVEQVLNSTDSSDALGIRDRAMLEVLYSTGMRRHELAALTVYSIDAERQTVLICQGKGRKDRVIPIGERAAAWVEKYRLEVRPELVLGQDEGVLFLTVEGRPFSLCRLTQLATRYLKQSGVGKTGACHLFRHSMATHMLENGADIRHIQVMLGHALISTTEIYAQVSIKHLQRVHRQTHPSGCGRVREEGE